MTERTPAEALQYSMSLDSRTSAPRAVVGAMFGNMLGVNTVLTFTFGIFISAFHAAFGWPRADIALSMTGFTVVAFLGSSLVGKAADRKDPGRLAVASMFAYGIGLLLVPVLVGSVQALWAAYVGLAILGLGTSPVVLNRPLISAFSRHRGLAIALALTGTGIGGFVLPQLTAALVARGGWQYGFTGLGVTVVIAAPVVWVGLSKGKAVQAPIATEREVVEPGMFFGEIYRLRVFWQLSIIAVCGGLGMSGPVAHLVPLLGDHAIGPQAAAKLASIIGVASIIGRLLTGVALDRFHTPLPGAPMLASGVVGLLLLSRFDPATAALAIALLGFVIGAEIAILSYYSSRYFGLRAHATVFGWMYGAVAFGSAIGPVLVGALRDHLGNYSLGFALSALILGAASLMCLMLGPYRYPADMRNDAGGFPKT